MNILLTGSSGFIGQHLTRKLTAAGHHVVGVSRRDGVDFNNMLRPADWHPNLDGIDAVINAVGIIAEKKGQSFLNLHHLAPVALFQACEQKGIRRVIQISALGADDSAFSAYHLSKKAADEALITSSLDWFILRPSLVYGPGGASTAMFEAMASLPLIPVVARGRQMIQPVHIDDLLEVVQLCLSSNPTQQIIDVVGPEAISFLQWLQALRNKKGKHKTISLSAALWLAMAGAHLLKGLIPMLHPDNLRMLQKGNTASPDRMTQLLGRTPKHVP
ncbi:MAG: NAD(P)H-binding protein [Gammaproteobacteria bacterium]|nr:NAD(P)H-binding protein [Gammaproteobacteria bacterium]